MTKRRLKRIFLIFFYHVEITRELVGWRIEYLIHCKNLRLKEPSIHVKFNSTLQAVQIASDYIHEFLIHNRTQGIDKNPRIEKGEVYIYRCSCLSRIGSFLYQFKESLSKFK